VRFVLGFGPELPDGVASRDVVLAVGKGRASRPRGADIGRGPALITFTARSRVPLLPVIRSEEELLAQGAMTVLALALDRKDVILNAYPLTGPAGLALGLMPWLISGSTLVQHHPFDYAALVEQLLASGATVTALPSPVLAELAKDGVLLKPACRLRRLGTVWPSPDLAEPPPPSDGAVPLLFDLYPLGDLAGVVLRRELATSLSRSRLARSASTRTAPTRCSWKPSSPRRVRRTFSPSCRSGGRSCRKARRDRLPRTITVSSPPVCARRPQVRTAKT
jgi:mycobactin salicyl-AMP ligase